MTLNGENDTETLSLMRVIVVVSGESGNVISVYDATLVPFPLTEMPMNCFACFRLYL